MEFNWATREKVPN